MKKLRDLAGIPLCGSTVVIITYEEFNTHSKDFTQALHIGIDDVDEHKRYESLKNETIYLMEASNTTIRIIVGEPKPEKTLVKFTVINCLSKVERTLLDELGLPSKSEDILAHAIDKYGDDLYECGDLNWGLDVNNVTLDIYWKVKWLNKHTLHVMGVYFETS